MFKKMSVPQKSKNNKNNIHLLIIVIIFGIDQQ